MSNAPFVPKGPVYRDEEDKRAKESRNGVIQIRYVLFVLDEYLAGRLEPPLFTPTLIAELQRMAVTQIYRCAGHFRDDGVEIRGAAHKPPDSGLVPTLVAEMCDYVERNWDSTSPIHLASYVMWRMNWIHPFLGGNGRTARAISYLVLCGRLRMVIPGEPTIPELIVDHRRHYREALQEADKAWAEGKVDVSKMEDLMQSLLAKQLYAIHQAAWGAAHSNPKSS